MHGVVGSASQAAIARVQRVMGRRDKSGGHTAWEGLVDQEARHWMARVTQRSRGLYRHWSGLFLLVS
jgi:hypothetical protein